MGIDFRRTALWWRLSPQDGLRRVRGQKLGILGGSFNPAHRGHLHLSREALKRLGLDAVIWLVSPQNPLKSKGEMASYARRLSSAKAMAQGASHLVSELEKDLHLAYSLDTIRLLSAMWPGKRLVWLLGEDNFLALHLWKEGLNFLNYASLAVFARPKQGGKRLAGALYSARAAKRLKRYRHRNPRSLLRRRCWAFVPMPPSPLSSSRIRQALPGWANEEGKR